MTSKLAPGAVIDGFSIEEKIHQGGMSTLWRVTHADFNFAMVMKVPRLEYGDDPAAIVGLEVEQMIMPTLSGLHVPRFVAAGNFSIQPYIVMEYINGPSLRARLDDAPLPPDEVALLGVRLATALHDLHRQHVIHLDIKPSSVIFRPGGEAVLIDYGLAHHNQLPDLLAEQFHLPLGTGPYMSPEQVLGVRSDSRSDLFALGVTLYHLATGQRPFGNPMTVSGLRRRLYRDALPPRAIRADCPPWLQEIILHCLEVEPSARYGSAGQVAFDLQHPQQVALTSRAQRTARDGFSTVAKRWFAAAGGESRTKASVADQLSSVPIIMAAVDVTPGNETLAEVLRDAVRRVLQTQGGARLACVFIRKTSRVAMDSNVAEDGQNLHLQLLAELRHWARALRTKDNRITYHVLEAHDAATAIVDFAQSNHIDHIVIGARGSSPLRRYLGSVSSQVVAEAACTVTVVRVRGTEEPALEPTREI
jgi:nucleotide-binding universal stress UspA family protein